MWRTILLMTFFSFLFVAFLSCSEDEKKLGTAVSGTYQASSSFRNWWSYHSQNIKFYKDFVPFDVNSNAVSVDSFMKLYASGEYIVHKFSGSNFETQYKLHRLDQNVEYNLKVTLKNIASADYRDYEKIGKPLPNFNFMDLQGCKFTKENTRNKFVIMKFWFIGCKPCVAEMPDLNKLVDKYHGRDDMIFLSLAFDSEKALKTFLKKRKFEYKVVANKMPYLTDTLKVRGYPTHLVINKEGKVEKICSSAIALKSILNETAYQ